MNEAKAHRIMATLNGVARKVYDAVPIREPWGSGRIVGELVRTGHNIDKRTVEGCLTSLVESGLVVERVRGEFLKAAIKAPCAPTVAFDPLAYTVPDPSDPPPATRLQPKAPELLDRMTAISERLRELAAAASALAKEVEDTALTAQQRIEGAHADASKLRQLQQLLRSIESGTGA